MRVLLTGATGFAGSHLAEFITVRHPHVALYGTYRWRSRLDNLDDLAASGSVDVLQGALPQDASLRTATRAGRLTLLECDHADPFAIAAIVRAVEPDRVFHVAAQSFVPASFAEPATTLATNILGELHLLEAVRSHAPRRACSSPDRARSTARCGRKSYRFGRRTSYDRFHPMPSARSPKTGWRGSTTRATAFTSSSRVRSNHTGPRGGDVFAESSFARQIAEIELERRPGVIRVGDLSSERDWHDVRDTARAYWLALEHGATGEVYNVGSGTSLPVREVLQALLAFVAGPSVTVEEDPARLRPSDVPILCADATKFRDRTGWSPAIPLERSLADLLEWWRARLRKR